MTINELKIYLQEHPGYLNKPNYGRIAERTNSRYEDVKRAIKELTEPKFERLDIDFTKPNKPISIHTFNKDTSHEFEEFLAWKARRKGMSTITGDKIVYEAAKKLPKPFVGGNVDNVLVVGDLHAPFVLDGYLEFCREQQEKFNCGTVVFIGDIVDGNAWSYHENDPDGMSVGTEINRSIVQLKDWYEVFPVATVLYGNHDLLVARKARTAGLSKLFIRELPDILQAPKSWNFVHEFVKDNVKYVHGSVGDAIKRAKDERISIVQGHLHTEAFVEYAVSERDAIFGMNVGCGIDHKAFAFEYAKPFPKKPVISCGIVLDKGTLPIVKLMSL